MGGQQKNPDHMQMIPDVVADIRSRPSVLSNIADPQNHSSGLSRAPMPFSFLGAFIFMLVLNSFCRLAPVQLDDILNQSTIPSDSSSQRSVQFRNSPTEQVRVFLSSLDDFRKFKVIYIELYICLTAGKSFRTDIVLSLMKTSFTDRIKCRGIQQLLVVQKSTGVLLNLKKKKWICCLTFSLLLMQGLRNFIE
ncbi:hypothetical protein PRUPE_1G511500 [Prunus persica]|uniref:Uncharacterized protein n=1 Tax=Prunus persica TaxID=3760 RepID=A0A251RG78_PRUPE|nr:hypothetical protein PRUPE_1G511500 [Prunus persica]